uniref:UDP-glucuronosyltransferase n=1 Tax=Brachionus koreanus TaxID=1199090 RepID=A0A7H9SLF7_9BILA|nr:UDP-glucuronosyltransferase-like protein 7 [Brachionus koreanus]
MKIFVLVLPEIGHINPVNGIVKELVHKKNCDVIFYGRHDQRELIESTGAKFREYKFYEDGNTALKPLKEDPFTNDIPLFINLINLSYNEIPCLIKDIEIDRPDLIIFDQLSMPAKYLLKVMEQNFREKKTSLPAPASVQIFTTFPSFEIFADKQEYKKYMLQPTGIFFRFNKYLLTLKQKKFCNHFGIDCLDPYELCENFQSKLNIVTFIPEIQPFKEFLSPTFKFVGICADENYQQKKQIDSKLKEILEKTDPVNPNYQNIETRFNLIYVSLGTVFNNNIFVFDCVIETIKQLNEVSKNLIVVLAVGNDNLNIYQKQIDQGFKVPENILLMTFVPQIELLKRAKLFITHCGMNSSSEAIHYGVPIIGIPIKADQPILAHIMCNELKLGIHLDALSITTDNLQDAILKIFQDQSFSIKAKELSLISRNYKGSSVAAELIYNFINTEQKS